MNNAPHKILLVEDNELNRDMLSRRLALRGFVVSIAVDGVQAVDKAAREMPDLILMDISLPEMDGWEATRRIKAAAATPFRRGSLPMASEVMPGMKIQSPAVSAGE